MKLFNSDHHYLTVPQTYLHVGSSGELIEAPTYRIASFLAHKVAFLAFQNCYSEFSLRASTLWWQTKEENQLLRQNFGSQPDSNS